MSLQKTGIFSLLMILGISIQVQADEKDDLLKKQKTTALENLKKLDVKTPVVVETPSFFIAGAMAEDKAKALGDGLQKMYTQVTKSLKFEESDKPWDGKLAVYIFADSDQFSSFLRTVAMRRPEKDERSVIEAKGATPFMALAPRRGDKNPNFEIEAGSQLAAGLLLRRAGTEMVPDWMKEGFVRATMMRLYPKTAGADRAEMRKLAVLPKSTKIMPILQKAWEGDNAREKELAGASLMEYLVYGPGSPKFATFIGSMRPSDEVRNPTVDTAIKAAEWTPEGLDKAWRIWVLQGSR